MFYYLTITFKRTLFFVNLHTSLQKNYFSLTLGLFLKFLKKRKSFKKNKTVRLLAMRFLRKFFISLSFKNLFLRVCGVPFEFNKLLAVLQKPIIHQFVDPLSNKVIDETTREYRKKLLHNPIFVTPFIHFVRTKSYTYLKQKKRGRVKRKIRRRLVKMNNLVD